jgi:hypothetical protein
LIVFESFTNKIIFYCLSFFGYGYLCVGGVPIQISFSWFQIRVLSNFEDYWILIILVIRVIDHALLERIPAVGDNAPKF